MIIGLPKLPGLFALIKSAGDPLVDVAGAYFPAWLACMLVGVAGTWFFFRLAARFGFSRALQPPVVMGPCLFTALTCGTWLLVFSA